MAELPRLKDFLPFDGRFVVSTTANGFVIYPLLGNQIRNEFMRVIQGQGCWQKIGPELKKVSKEMDSMNEHVRNQELDTEKASLP